MDRDMLKQEFSAKTVAQAAGREIQHVANWGHRGFMLAQPMGDGARVNGPHRSYSFFDMAQTVVAVALMEEFGLSARTAFGMAVEFAHGGDAPAGYAASSHPREPERLPGLPYHYSDGDTLLVTRGAPPTIELSADGKISLEGDALGSMILNLTGVCQRMMNRLGHDWRQVLDKAYGVEG